MNIKDKIELIGELDKLIRDKKTGPPPELAKELNLSERGLYNVLNLIREMGAPVYYSKKDRSYCYKYEVEFAVGYTDKNINSVK